ncbi:MAG: biopolymer transporter ExbD [Prevotellaceae bacterium]|nr:biopolymer transporter ExbD [Candidatus Colivivens equi]
MGKKKKVPGLNASSTADISFILLIFFLVTTSMDTDQGLGRTLPKPPEDDEINNELKVKERNILNIRINKNNDIMFRDDFTVTPKADAHNVLRLDPGEALLIKQETMRFIANKENNPNLPELKSKDVPLIGRCMVTENHVISVQTDRGTSYGVYFMVQDIIVSAYNELRDELAKEKFNYKFEFLSKEQQAAIKEVYPQKISEAEPRQYGKAL